jgi:outer membrane murein-binding lipoprotein Lpp
MAASTSSRRKAASEGAKLGEKDFMSRLTEAGEEALHRISELPGGKRAVTAFNDLRNRVDDLSKRVRGIEKLEARVEKLEKDVAALKRAKPAARRTPSSRGKTTPPSSA